MQLASSHPLIDMKCLTILYMIKCVQAYCSIVVCLSFLNEVFAYFTPFSCPMFLICNTTIALSLILRFGILKKKDVDMTPNKMSAKLAGKALSYSLLPRSLSPSLYCSYNLHLYAHTALEAACQSKDDELYHKEQIIKDLQKTIATMKTAHKHQLEDLKLQAKQNSYLSSLPQTGTKTHNNYTQPHTKRKAKH